MSKHTATPWKIAGQSDGGRYIKITGASGRTVARVPFSSEADGYAGTATDAANADHIVRCVNAWDDATALRARLAELETNHGG